MAGGGGGGLWWRRRYGALSERASEKWTPVTSRFTTRKETRIYQEDFIAVSPFEVRESGGCAELVRWKLSQQLFSFHEEGEGMGRGWGERSNRR